MLPMYNFCLGLYCIFKICTTVKDLFKFVHTYYVKCKSNNKLIVKKLGTTMTKCWSTFATNDS